MKIVNLLEVALWEKKIKNKVLCAVVVIKKISISK